MSKRWYVVHAYSGFEDKVKKNLEERIEALGQKEYFMIVCDSVIHPG